MNTTVSDPPPDVKGARQGAPAARHLLLHLNESGLTVADDNADIRGRKVFDAAGEEIGKVEDLVIDKDEHRVRFLQLGAGGFLGIGEHRFLIPVDAVTRLSPEAVYVSRTREHVASGPVYDPDLVRDDSGLNYEGIYAYYGIPPFWMAGYQYPTYPYFRIV
jgi:sporulation protein YlmC with PRC-barrel domain